MISREECETRCIYAIRDALDEILNEMEAESPGWKMDADYRKLISGTLSAYDAVSDLFGLLSHLYKRATGNEWVGQKGLEEDIRGLCEHYEGTLKELSKED